MNWNHRQYRRAKLTVEGPKEIDSRFRTNLSGDPNLANRGTVQHRCFETNRAFASDEMVLKVFCAGQAGGLESSVPFALAVSLEVGAAVGIQVYDLVRERMKIAIR